MQKSLIFQWVWVVLGVISLVLISSCADESSDSTSTTSSTETSTECTEDTIFATASDLSIPLLVVMVEFEDQKFTYDSANEWNSKIFGSSSGQLNHYYKDISGGTFAFTPSAESQGCENDGIIRVSLSSDHPNPGESGVTRIFLETLEDALNVADNDIDFSSYDNELTGNDTNEIEPQELQVMFILAGYEASYDSEKSPSVWAHAYEINGAYGVGPLSYDGVKVLNPDANDNGSGYSVFGEIQEESATIGVIAHELGHAAFGLPDLYDTDGTSEGIGAWGLMGGGSWGQKWREGLSGDTPVPLSAWSKMQLFYAPSTATPGLSSIIIRSYEDVSSDIVKIATSASNEYFLLENRQPVGYDLGLERFLGKDFNGGIAIWHIDDGVPDNTDENHRLVDLELANGEINNQTNLFFLGNSTTFDASSDPNSNLYPENESGVAVEVLSVSGTSMTVNVTAP